MKEIAIYVIIMIGKMNTILYLFIHILQARRLHVLAMFSQFCISTVYVFVLIVYLLLCTLLANMERFVRGVF